MNLEYLLLPIGTVLLVIPTALVCGAKMREKLDQPTRHHNEGIWALMRSRMNWIDLLRGAAGGWLVQKPFADNYSAQDELAPTFLAVQMAIMLIGAIAQTVWLRRPVRVVGPVFFLTGLTLALSGPLTGGFALVLGFTCALMIGRISTVFSIVPVAVIGFGFLFRDFGPMNALNAAAYALPAFLAFTFGIRISFVRNPIDTRDHALRMAPAKAQQPKQAVAAVIRPDFEHPAPPPVEVSEPSPALAKPEPAVALKLPDDPAPLPDFLRIAEDPEPPQSRVRRRLFPLRGA
jgi:hypothetical protein